MITSLINGAANAPQASSSTQSNSQAAGSGTDALANEQTFLKLLVAQMQNQDPTQPQDGTQFVTQLATFSSLEQEIAMRQDLDAISKTTAPATTTGTPRHTNKEKLCLHHFQRHFLRSRRNLPPSTWSETTLRISIHRDSRAAWFPFTTWL